MKTALITGASSGIGMEFAKEFASQGYRLILIARRQNILDSLAAEIESRYGIKHIVISADLSHQNAAKEIFDKVMKLNISVDVLINNAGFATKGLLSKTDFDKQRREINCNVLALTELTYLFIDKMADKKSGSIINIASASAFNPIPYNAVYAATKAYVLSFSQSINYEYSTFGIHSIAVCPQATDTHFFDDFNKMKGKMRSPKDVVNTTLKGLSHNKVVVADGGMSKIQSIMHHILTRKMRVKITGKVGQEIWGNN